MVVLFRLRQLFQRVQAFFLVERHGEQNGFHGVVVALIGGRLGVAADAVETDVAWETPATGGSRETRRRCPSACWNDAPAAASRTSSSKYKSGSAVTISASAEKFRSSRGRRASSSVN